MNKSTLNNKGSLNKKHLKE